jgi:hypothetical protein
MSLSPRNGGRGKRERERPRRRPERAPAGVAAERAIADGGGGNVCAHEVAAARVVRKLEGGVVGRGGVVVAAVAAVATDADREVVHRARSSRVARFSGRRRPAFFSSRLPRGKGFKRRRVYEAGQGRCGPNECWPMSVCVCGRVELLFASARASRRPPPLSRSVVPPSPAFASCAPPSTRTHAHLVVCGWTSDSSAWDRDVVVGQGRGRASDPLLRALDATAQSRGAKRRGRRRAAGGQGGGRTRNARI